MLDLKTVLIVEVCSAGLQSATWFFVWLSWRNLYELKFLCAGFLAITFGLVLMLLRGPEPDHWHIILDNMMIKLGVVLLAQGLARFLGQPRYTVVAVAILLAFAGAMVAIDYSNLSARIHASTVFTTVMMLLMSLTLLRDRTQPALLRFITIAVLIGYLFATILHSYIEIVSPASSVASPILSDRNAWYLFQGNLYLISLFACLLFMVGVRLSADLRDKNVALSAEIEERRRLEAELSDSLVTERSLREEQQQLVRMVSHEFRTPLAVIQRSTEMLGITLSHPPEAASRRLSVIQQTIGRLSMLIDRFLATDDRPANVLDIRPLEPAILSNDLATHVEAQGQSDRVVYEVEDDLPEIHADRDLLLTVLANLVDNALKYSSDDHGVRVAVQRQSDGVVFTVTDTGIGIPPAERPRIGERYFRASNAKSENGSGLGLHNCYRLLSHHGGDLAIDAAPTGGTVATLRL